MNMYLLRYLGIVVNFFGLLWVYFCFGYEFVNVYIKKKDLRYKVI